MAAGRARAKRNREIARIGIIDDLPSWDPFRQQLRELNYVEGQNLAYESLSTNGNPDQLDAAAAALAQAPVTSCGIRHAAGPGGASRHENHSYRRGSISDPIAAGLVTSLAHPIGNVTGNTILGPDIVTKKLQVLKDAIPTVARVAYLWNPTIRLLPRFWRICERRRRYST